MSHCERFFANFLLVLFFSMAVICLLPNGRWPQTVNRNLEHIVVRCMVLPIITPLAAFAGSSMDIIGGNGNDENGDNDKDKRPPRPPCFLFHLLDMDIARYSLISYLNDELSTYAENVFPLSQTKEVLENRVVLTDIAFRGLYQEKKVSTNNSNLIWHQCRLSF